MSSSPVRMSTVPLVSVEDISRPHANTATLAFSARFTSPCVCVFVCHARNTKTPKTKRTRQHTAYNTVPSTAAAYNQNEHEQTNKTSVGSFLVRFGYPSVTCSPPRFFAFFPSQHSQASIHLQCPFSLVGNARATNKLQQWCIICSEKAKVPLDSITWPLGSPVRSADRTCECDQRKLFKTIRQENQNSTSVPVCACSCACSPRRGTLLIQCDHHPRFHFGQRRPFTAALLLSRQKLAAHKNKT